MANEKLIGLVVNAHMADDASKNTLEHLCFIAEYLADHGVRIPVLCDACVRHAKCQIEEKMHFVSSGNRYCCLGERKDNERKTD
jgi:hypothetical protein